MHVFAFMNTTAAMRASGHNDTGVVKEMRVGLDMDASNKEMRTVSMLIKVCWNDCAQ